MYVVANIETADTQKKYGEWGWAVSMIRRRTRTMEVVVKQGGGRREGGEGGGGGGTVYII